MLGIELVDAAGEPNSQAAAAAQRGAIERGLILELGGRGDCVLRMLPPLNVTRETLDQAFEILDAALADATDRGAAGEHVSLSRAV
jgi:diaminobutyrate-2-oxoglutarate transaminase